MSDVRPVPFPARVAAAVAERRSPLVVGLDPDPERVPGGVVGAGDFCCRVVAAVRHACVAVKIQLAAFERFGAEGWGQFERVALMAESAGLLVIADAKRGDVGVTSRHYAEAFLRFPIDAMTINPMLGGDAVEPFVARARAEGRGLFALVRNSNPGAAELQDLPIAGGGLWHEHLARRVAAWGADDVDAASGLSALGAVVGATIPERLATLRRLMPAQIFLVPGVGAQGGRAADLGPVFAGNPAAALVPVSRAIIYADDPAAAAERLRAELWAVAGGAA